MSRVPFSISVSAELVLPIYISTRTSMGLEHTPLEPLWEENYGKVLQSWSAGDNRPYRISRTGGWKCGLAIMRSLKTRHAPFSGRFL